MIFAACLLFSGWVLWAGMGAEVAALHTELSAADRFRRFAIASPRAFAICAKATKEASASIDEMTATLIALFKAMREDQESSQ